jgi:hypothetical protein
MSTSHLPYESIAPETALPELRRHTLAPPRKIRHFHRISNPTQFRNCNRTRYKLAYKATRSSGRRSKFHHVD